MTGESVYSALLIVYPKSFRQQYGSAMLQAFRDLRRTSRLTAFRFWLFIVTDTCQAAWLEHVQGWTCAPRLVALKWISACVVGAVACDVMGSAMTWSFGYFYHPYLEGITFMPWMYGALLGAGLGAAQSLMLDHPRNRATWIVITAASAAFGLELASTVAALTGPVGYGVIVGIVVAGGQWIALREHLGRAGLLALASAATVASTAVAGSVALTRALAGMDALKHDPPYAHPGLDVLLRGLYAPMNWDEWLLGLVAMAMAGLVVGAVTAKPASALLARAH